MYCCYAYLICSLFWMCDSYSKREYRFPDFALAFNTRRVNLTHRFGYSGQKLVIVGLLVFIADVTEVENEIMKDSSERIILFLPLDVFADKYVMTIILECKRVMGVIMLSGNTSLSNLTFEFFSELPNCVYSDNKLCSSETVDIYSNGYFFFIWTIPIVMLKHKPQYQKVAEACYKKYNVKPKNKQQCLVEIYNYSMKKTNYKMCSQLEGSWRTYFSLAYKYQYCKPYNGYNIYVTFNNVVFYKERSVILIYTKTDAMSMFDSAAYGVRDLYPSLGAMIYMSKLIQKAVEEGMLDQNSDILMAFVDNNNIGQMGASRLFLDLKNNRINNTVYNISDKNIKLIIYLGELDSSHNVLTFTTHQCQRNQLCITLKQLLLTYAKTYGIELRNRDYDEVPEHMKTWKSIPVPSIEIRSSMLSHNLFKNSFLDRELPSDLLLLENFSKVIVCTLIKMLISLKKKDAEYNPTFTEFSPANITQCLFNISCQHFQWFIGKFDTWLYTTYASPFIAQSFINEVTDAKQQPYLNRLSFFVLKLLVIMLKRQRTSIKDCQSGTNIKYFETKIDDKPFCFEAKIQVETDFDLDMLQKDDNNVNYSFSVYKKVTTYTTQQVMLYISHDVDVANTLMVIYTIFFVLCLLGSLFIYRSIHVFISEEVF